MKILHVFGEKDRRRSFIQAGLLGGLVVFLWCMFSWTVLPWHKQTMHPFKDEHKVLEVIKDTVEVSGIYAAPTSFSSSGSEPFIVASVHLGGMRYGITCSVIVSLLIQVAAAFLITYLLLQTKHTKYVQKVFFVAQLGLLVSVLSYLPAWNWWEWPLDYTIINFVDTIIAWFIGGLVIAKFVKKSVFAM